jgi:ankyrin repeat protein
MAVSADEFKEAAWRGDRAVLDRYLAGGGDPNVLAPNGVNALVSPDPEILEYLAGRGADPSRAWGDGNPPICFHAWEVNGAALRWFLDKGVDPNSAHRGTGEGSLHALTAKPDRPEERFAMIHLLTERGADPNLRARAGVPTGSFWRDVTVVGETPLHRAAAYQPLKTVQLLLDYGADKTLKDARGETPLSWASRHWREREILRVLLHGDHPPIR